MTRRSEDTKKPMPQEEGGKRKGKKQAEKREKKQAVSQPSSLDLNFEGDLQI